MKVTSRPLPTAYYLLLTTYCLMKYGLIAGNGRFPFLVLEGAKTCVPAGMYADGVIVSATTEDGPALFLVDPTAAGVTREVQQTIS